jgi:hypothetical protein
MWIMCNGLVVISALNQFHVIFRGLFNDTFSTTHVL